MRHGVWFRAFLIWFTVGCAACEPRTKARRSIAPPPRASSTLAASAPPIAGKPEHGPGDIARGRDLVQRFECNRCHEGTGFGTAPPSKNCFSCHDQISTGRFPVSPAALARFRPHVASALEAPSLTAIGDRLDPEWVASYLLTPRDLRPTLRPTMPRLALDSVQARDIVAFLMRDVKPPRPEPRAAGNARHGRALIDEKGCATCHAFGGVPAFVAREPPPEGSQAARAASLAPDLRFTRDRFQLVRLTSWLLDPQAVKADTLMPNFGLAPDDAADIAAYILKAPLAPLVPMTFTRLPPLTRRVSFAEVDRQVFSRTCHHCHSDPESSGGDGGPGNTGGFGFAPRGVSFSSHRSILSGYIDAHGERRSLFEPLSIGTPRIVAALLARHAESGEAAKSDGVGLTLETVPRGMPLGLPPLSAEDIQLVETWVAQGEPL